MFEAAELGHKVRKHEYEAREPGLRTDLLHAQEALKEANFPVLVLVSGVDGAGKGDMINQLNAWFDPRDVRGYAFGDPSDEERERPEYWRFWRALPPKGEIGLYVGSWYSRPIGDRVANKSTEAELETELARVNAFEEALISDGALIIKFWLHLSKDAQKKRMKKWEKNPATAWRVTSVDKKHLKLYDHFASIAERTLRLTSTGQSPWIIVEATDERYRNLTVGQHILDRINARIRRDAETVAPSSHLRPIVAPEIGKNVTVLGQLDLSQTADKSSYKKVLAHHQGRLAKLIRQAREKQVSSIAVLEGWDAAGKGGLIRRIIPAMDARNYQIIPIGAPTDEERAHHYLWRFWRHIPRAGNVTIYDRSWYGRVLVERIEGFATRDEWMRAYTEINDFEEQLTRHGIVVLKFWLHISKDVQLARFKDREKIPFKRYKITEDDYRNRDKWDDYECAVTDMVERTSTESAPWNLVEANDKHYARLKALHIYCERMERVLDKLSGTA
ncbi:MAG: polyphosphate:AMP phosphotransferase [Gammaproteobacteria bacterium]